MSDSPELEEAAATLDDVSLTLDEVVDSESKDAAGLALDRAKTAVSDASDALDEVLLLRAPSPSAMLEQD